MLKVHNIRSSAVQKGHQFKQNKGIEQNRADSTGQWSSHSLKTKQIESLYHVRLKQLNVGFVRNLHGRKSQIDRMFRPRGPSSAVLTNPPFSSPMHGNKPSPHQNFHYCVTYHSIEGFPANAHWYIVNTNLPLTH